MSDETSFSQVHPSQAPALAEAPVLASTLAHTESFFPHFSLVSISLVRCLGVQEELLHVCHCHICAVEPVEETLLGRRKTMSAAVEAGTAAVEAAAVRRSWKLS